MNLSHKLKATKKFIQNPKNIQNIGSGIQEGGKAIALGGAASGQPEFVALGAGLTKAGGILEKSGKIAQKYKKKK